MKKISEPESSNNRRVVRVLSIDGGGIRGIIAAFILQKIEEQLSPGRTLISCFDLIAGTSTGGIIALLLSLPKNNQKDQKQPKYKANDIVKLYEEFGRNVFTCSLSQVIKSGYGLWGSKYSSQNLESYLQTYFKNARLKDTLTNVFIPAYEIERDKVFFFNSIYARKAAKHDCFVRDLARATSAAPTYFDPAILVTGEHERFTFVDGGVAVNNPTVSSVAHAIHVFGEEIDIHVLSLGTGTNFGDQTKRIDKNKMWSNGLLGWANNIVPVFMYAANDATDDEMAFVFNQRHVKKYYRFQPIIEVENTDMDRVDEKNIQDLKQYAEKIINKKQREFKELIYLLNESL